MRLTCLLCVLFLAAVPCSAAPAADTGYPSKPIRLVIGSPAGGSTDILARVIAQKLNESMGQMVVVDPRPGASGVIAGEIAARANADGYTLLFPSLQHVINVGLYSKLSFDPIRDFEPIAQVANVPMFLVTHPSLPVKTVGDLIALARSKPGALSFSSSGIGTPQHLGMELLRSAAKIDMVHVPFKGAADSITEVVAGRVPVGIITVPPGLPHVKAGKLVAVASAGGTRIQVLPNLPTIAESGLPGFAVDNWIGMAGPLRTPQAVANRLHAELARIIGTPEMKERMASLGFAPAVTTPAEFLAIMKNDAAKYARVAKATGAQLN
ncbi:MAG: bug [Betaproteobacteria bacterium]|jgi:tripartite-type tricarboxylate transporter receptor subunit TctC|nr:bug [Betaproteobacteria bacterium]